MKTAQKIARELLYEHVCACANIWPIKSMYWWKGKLQNRKEVAVFFKAKKEKKEVLKARIAELHPYETPAIIELTPSAVAKKYLMWLGET
jgi:periplasmic divalent cation tolerance protein